MAAVILLVVDCMVWLKSAILRMWSFVRAVISSFSPVTDRWRERALDTRALEVSAWLWVAAIPEVTVCVCVCVCVSITIKLGYYNYATQIIYLYTTEILIVHFSVYY